MAILTPYQRVKIGCVAGLIPGLLFFATSDQETITYYLGHLQYLQVLSYGLKLFALCVIGAVVAYYQEATLKPAQILMIGLSAPTLFNGYLTTTAQNKKIQNLNTEVTQDRPLPKESASFFPMAYATEIETGLSTGSESLTKKVALNNFTLPEQSTLDRIQQGFFAQQPDNIWFVIAGAFRKIENAEAYAEQINSTYKDFKAEVYAPYQNDGLYRVSIGANLSKDQANEVKNKAIQSGLDAFIRTFNNLPPSPSESPQ